MIDGDVFTKKDQLDQLVKELEELVNQYESMGKKISDDFDTKFISYVRHSFKNVELEDLEFLEEEKNKLVNLIFIEKIKEFNVLLDKAINKDDKFKDNSDNYIRVISKYLNRINSINNSSDYFSEEEYQKFFGLVYKVIKLILRYGLSTDSLNDICALINRNKDIINIINALLVKDYEIVKNSKVVSDERFTNFVFKYLSNESFSELNSLVSLDLIKAIVDSYGEEEKEVLLNGLSECDSELKSNFNYLSLKLGEIEKESSKIPNYDKVLKSCKDKIKSKVLPLILSGVLAIGAGSAVKAVSQRGIDKYNSGVSSYVNTISQNEIGSYNSMEQYEKNKVISNYTSIILGIIASIIVGCFPKFSVRVYLEKINSLRKSMDENNADYKIVENKINELKSSILKATDVNKEILDNINLLLDELLIKFNESEFVSDELQRDLNENEINLLEVKKLSLK